MTVRGFERRLSVLEAIVEEVRTRPIRQMVVLLTRDYGFSNAEIDEATEIALTRMRQLDVWRREGVSEREIMARTAAELDGSVDDLIAEYEDLQARFGLTG